MFRRTWQEMSGDNVFPGRNNRIVWSIAKEYPEGIREGEYYFVFSVELDQETSTGAGTTLIVAGGPLSSEALLL